MPDIDRTVDIKVIAAQGMVTAEIPLAGHASEHWLTLFHLLAMKGGSEPVRRPRSAGTAPGSSSGCLPTARASIQNRCWMP
jgi:hypothetical protein